MNSPTGRHCPPIKALSLTVPLPAFRVAPFNLLRTIRYVNIEQIHSGAGARTHLSLITHAFNLRTYFYHNCRFLLYAFTQLQGFMDQLWTNKRMEETIFKKTK